MYDAATTRKAIETQNVKQGWELIEYDLGEIEEAEAHLSHIFDSDNMRMRRALNDKETRFIRNERRLCRLDFRYWATRYAWIISRDKKPVRFTPNIAQNIILDLWAEDEAIADVIWMQQLKARRLGVSTLSELAIQHRFQFIPYTRAVVASADPAKTMDMASIIGFSLSRQPWWLLPQGKPKIKGGLPVEYTDIQSKLTIQAGNQFTGVARGGSPNCLHLSELCEWQDAAELIDAALLPAIQDFPGTFGIMESTGQGDTEGKSWWQATWEQNNRDWMRGRARLRPVFLPYYVGTDIFPTEADMIRHPIPANWIPSDRTVAHAERARDYVLNTPLLMKYVAKGNKWWTLPREQMWWRERMYETAKEKRELHIFLTEYCADAFEAFQTSMSPVVDPEVLMSYQERSREPIASFTVIGPDIPPPLVVPQRYWDSSQKPITVATRELMPRFDVKYQFQPVKIDSASFDGSLVLNIWEWPEQGETYGLGADLAEGVGLDNTVLEIVREATPVRYPGQVAEFASSYITAFQVWPVAIAMACFYSTFKPSAGKRTQLRAAIECFANGKHVQHEMQKRGWHNFHPWKQYDNRKQTPDFKVNKLGVYTNHSFRSGMMDMLLTMLSEEAIDLPSKYLVHELTKLVNIGGKVQAAAGEKDDRIMALGFPLFSLHVGKSPSRQYTRKRVEYIPNSDDLVKPNYAVWQPDTQYFDTPNPALMRVEQRPGFRRQVELLRAVNPRMPAGYR